MREQAEPGRCDERAVTAPRPPRVARRGRISYCTGRLGLPFVKMRVAVEIRRPLVRERAPRVAHVASRSRAGASA